MRRPRTGVIEVEDFLPHRELAASDQYPVMASIGACHGTCIVPCVSMRRYELIALWRGSDRPRLEEDRAELLTMLFPHIQNALRIQAALGLFQDRAETAESMLNATSTASFLLSATGRLLHMNAAAQSLALARDGFAERDGRIMPVHLEHKARWSELIAAAGRRDHAGGALMLGRAAGKRPLQVLVSPFHADTPGRPGRVLVLATEPDRAVNFPDTVLRQLYGLTMAETEIANGLLTGFPPEAIAGLRGVSVGTVRSQIKSLLLKTETRRQTDLLRLLHTLRTTAGDRHTEVAHVPHLGDAGTFVRWCHGCILFRTGTPCSIPG